jgi:hypothetical protein
MRRVSPYTEDIVVEIFETMPEMHVGSVSRPVVDIYSLPCVSKPLPLPFVDGLLVEERGNAAWMRVDAEVHGGARWVSRRAAKLSGCLLKRLDFPGDIRQNPTGSSRILREICQSRSPCPEEPVGDRTVDKRLKGGLGERQSHQRRLGEEERAACGGGVALLETERATVIVFP